MRIAVRCPLPKPAAGRLILMAVLAFLFIHCLNYFGQKPNTISSYSEDHTSASKAELPSTVKDSIMNNSFDSINPWWDPFSYYLKATRMIDNRDGNRGPGNFTFDKSKEMSRSSKLRWIEMFFEGKKNGTFLEAGANDGVWLSTTLFLEEMYSWTGVLVEAVPRKFKQLVATNRRAVFLEGCVGTKIYPHTADMAVPTQNNSYDGESVGFAYLDGHRVLRIPGKKEEIIQMDCYPLFNILDAAGLRSLDFLSLDVNGPEALVMKTLPWELVDIKLISLELDPIWTQERTTIFKDLMRFMSQHGYKRVAQFSTCDQMFVKKTYG